MSIKALEARHAPDGSAATILITTDDGTVSVPVDHTQWGPLLVSVLAEMQAASRLRSQAAGGDAAAKSFWPTGALRVTGMSGGITTEGVPLLSLRLAGGAELDLALDAATVAGLAEGLAGLAERARGTGAAPPRAN